MTQSNHEPTFNLFREPWITLERPEGPPVRAGIEKALIEANLFTGFYNPSPLVVVGIHRLLVAILQASLDPFKPSDLRNLWRAGKFPAERIKQFEEEYISRFDLFSINKPFMQSGELPLMLVKGEKVKTVAYLTAETSPLTAIDHYRHGDEESEYFCPSCMAAGLVTIPAFTGIGGRGFKASINGTPPLYVLPMGRNLFESLTLSLISPEENYWPYTASRKQDLPWWKHPPVINRGKELIEVGYLQSLTFPARQVRLHPLRLNSICTRCGQQSEWGAKTMTFEMGECRPKDSSPWSDPFVAYRLPDEGKIGNPWAILPDRSRALWREYAGLFLHPPRVGKKRVHRPAILDRIAAEEFGSELPEYRFRCIGVQTSQAKVLEWQDASFGVPASLINDEGITYMVRYATQFAEDCAFMITGIFRTSTNSSRRGDRHKVLRDQMLNHYWRNLANSFRAFILSLEEKGNWPQAREQWAASVTQQAQAVFEETISQVGDDAVSLRRQEEGKRDCRIRLARKRNKYLEQGVDV